MNREEIITLKEMTRHGIIKALLDGNMNNKEAAKSLKLSIRQVIRIKKKVLENGPKGIIHGNRGRSPTHAFSTVFKEQIITLVKDRYYDFNFSHLSEILKEEEGISINRETLRLWLRPLGYGGKIRKKPPHRKRRKRSEKEGQMLFLDGSPHHWFGETPSTLILCTDDATGKPLYGLFQKEEDLNGCFKVSLEVFKKYGLPTLFYLDRASQFTTTRHKGTHITQSDKKLTNFERAMQELGVRLIFANSPQARGRGERINGTLQDRLVSEMRLKGISDYKKANEYLNEIFIPKYGFGKMPEDSTSAWRLLPKKVDIQNIVCKRFNRTVKNDNTISVKNQVIQLLPTHQRLHFVKAKVTVNQWVDGSYHVFHDKFGEIPCCLCSNENQKMSEVRTVSGVRPAETHAISAGERSENKPVELLNELILTAPD